MMSPFALQSLLVVLATGNTLASATGSYNFTLWSKSDCKGTILGTMSGAIGTGACTLTSANAGSVDFQFIGTAGNGDGNFYALQPETNCGPGMGEQLNTCIAPSASGCQRINAVGPGYTYDGVPGSGSCVMSGGSGPSAPPKGRFRRGPAA